MTRTRTHLHGHLDCPGLPAHLAVHLQNYLGGDRVHSLGLAIVTNVKNNSTRSRMTYLRTVDVMHWEGMGFSMQVIFLMAA